MRYFIELVCDKHKFSANVLIGGYDAQGIFHKPRCIVNIKREIGYRRLRMEISRITHMMIPGQEYIEWHMHQGVSYSYMEGDMGCPPKLLGDVGRDYKMNWRESA